MLARLRVGERKSLKCMIATYQMNHKQNTKLGSNTIVQQKLSHTSGLTRGIAYWK